MADWIADTFTKLGYWGIALAMFLENVFPPIPSEAVLPAAGMTARRGHLSVWGVIAAGFVGSLAGAVLWYYIGRWVGTERLSNWADRRGKYFGFSRKDIERADAWFDRWGGPAVFIGRMIPGVRTLISVPAGISEMPLGRFLVYSAAGSALWSAFLVMVGWWLGQSAAMVEKAISWAGIVIFLVFVVWLGRRIWRARQEYRSGKVIHRDDHNKNESTMQERNARGFRSNGRNGNFMGRKEMKSINVLDARRLIAEEPDLTVIEALPEEYFDEAHLPGAKNVPLDDRFEEQVQLIAPDLHKPVMVYSLDAKSRTSHKAASRLERLGYENVYEFAGGKIEWQENGLPLE